MGGVRCRLPTKIRDSSSLGAPSPHDAYAIIAGPTPRREYVGQLRVSPRGPARCEVQFNARYLAAPGVMDAAATERLRTFYGVALDNLQVLFGK